LVDWFSRGLELFEYFDEFRAEWRQSIAITL